MANNQKSVLRIKKHEGEKVFEHSADLRLDRIPATLLSPLIGSGRIHVIRKGKICATARIEEVGVDTIAKRFIGLMVLVPQRDMVRGECAEFGIVSDPMRSRWFVPGDVVVLPCSPGAFRAAVLEHWRDVLQFAPAYAKEMKQGSARHEELSTRYHREFEKRCGFPLNDVLNNTRKMPRGEEARWEEAKRRMVRIAYRALDDRLRRERIPKVIRLTDS